MAHDFIGALMPEDTHMPPCGEFYCAGHSDETSANMHSTAWEYFGSMGVAVTRNGHDKVKVSLIEIEHPQADYDLDEVPQLILQLCQALAVAQRAALSVPADRLAAQVRELIASATA